MISAVGVAGRLIRVAATLVVVALATAVSFPVVAHADGGNAHPAGNGGVFVQYDGCAFVFSTGTIGGISSTGWSNAWIIKADPAYPEDRPHQRQGDPLPPCSFHGSVSLADKDQKPGDPDHSLPFHGDNADVASQRIPLASRDDEDGIRPKVFTVVLCTADGCSSALTGPA